MKKLLILILLSTLSLIALAQPKEMYAFNTPQQAQTFQKLTNDLRCLVCQNQSLADSNAPLASDLRHLIAEKLIEGENSQQISDYLVARYGEFILYQPPLNAQTYILWVGPFVLLLIIFLVLFLKKRRLAS